MAEMAEIDTGRLDETLQIRQAKKVIQQRGRGAAKEKENKRGFGMGR